MEDFLDEILKRLTLWIGLATAAFAMEYGEEPPSTEPKEVAEAINKNEGSGAYDQVIVGYLLKIADELRTKERNEAIALKILVSKLVQHFDERTKQRLLNVGGQASRFQLCEQTHTDYAALRFDPNARREAWMLPLQSISWSDEHPGWGPAPRCHKECEELILSVLSAREQLWEGEVLDEETSRLWDEVKRSLPDWPVFQRIELSKEDRRAHDEVRQATADSLEALLSSPGVRVHCPRCGAVLSHEGMSLAEKEKHWRDSCPQCGWP